MVSEPQRKGYGGWIFLAVVLAAYGLAGVIEPEKTVHALAFFSHVVGQVLPVLGLVFLLLFVAHVLLEPDRIKSYLGQRSGFTGWIAAVCAGVLSMGPVYAWYPLLKDLRQEGMRIALIAAFLYSRAIKLHLLPLMIHYFGWSYTLVLCCYLIGFSVMTGMTVEKLALPRHP